MWKRTGARVLLSLALTGAGLSSFAQETTDTQGGATIRKGKYSSVPYAYREMLRQQDLLNEGNDGRKVVDLVAEPMLNARGERLVGVIENHELTQRQLQERAQLIINHMPPINETDPQKKATLEQDRQALTESQLLAEWVQTTALAVHAEHTGQTVTEEEIDKAIEQLSQQSQTQAAETEQRLRMVGVDERELRQEIRDGLLVEKLVRDEVQKKFSEEEMRAIYKTDPSVFLEPTQAQVWHLYLPILRTPTRDQIKSFEKELKGLRKQLKKCDEPAEYEALVQSLTGRQDIVINDMGWIDEAEPLPAAVRKEIFALEPGQISDVIQSNLGLHVVKVLGRKDGSMSTFESARPQVENYLFEKIKPIIYEGIKGKYDVQKNASGLSIYRRKNQPKALITTTPGAGATTGTLLKASDLPEEPDLSALHQAQQKQEDDGLSVPSVEDVLMKNAEHKIQKQ